MIESYGYSAQITALNDSLDALSGYLDLLNGEIRRGIVRDPSTGQDVLGIAISQSLVFSSSETGPDGQTYYRIDSSLAQTFGLYTSTGWQFWINGSKRGWFDSTDGMLHVSQILVESRLQLGENWLVTTTGGFGIRKI